jgi:hypothetical protein
MSWLVIRAILGRALSFLGKLNLWQLGCIALALFAGVQTLRLAAETRHSHKVEAQAQKLSQELLQIRDNARKAEADGNRISKQLKDKNNEDNRRIAGDAESLRVSGPGKAVCRPAPAAPSGHIAVTAKPDAAGPALPPDDSAAVPWPWLVQRSEEHDQLLAEVEAWRTWHEQVLKVWPKNDGDQHGQR